MWGRIAERLVADCKEMDITCNKSAKQCRDKINNLNKKYKAVKDKSKLTGEGSEEIKPFPQFDNLDQIWGTRDSVSPKYVVEAGTSQPFTSTPAPSQTRPLVPQKVALLFNRLNKAKVPLSPTSSRNRRACCLPSLGPRIQGK